MSKEMKAFSLSIVSVVIVALIGFGVMNMLLWSCGESTSTSVECTNAEQCDQGGVCERAVCDGGLCKLEVIEDGTTCTDGTSGICLSGVCRDDICYIDNSVFYTAGSADGCNVCDPLQSITSWSEVECQPGIDSVCLEEPVCDDSDGMCQGTKCCKQEPAWNGVGEAPSCKLPNGGDGVCNENGDCVGCNDNTECDAGLECRVPICNAQQICEQQIAADGTECQIDGHNGKCLGGDCYKVCVNPTDCQNDQYCDDGLCMAKLSNGQACDDGEACVSGYCKPTCDGDSVDNRCAAVNCTVCECSTELGACEPVQNGTTTADCEGACSTTYVDGNWMCCDGNCTCVDGDSC